MRFRRTRIARLEARQRRQQPPHLRHFTPVVRVPHGIPHDDWGAWLAAQPCACRALGCPERRVGLLLPEKCESPEEWETHDGR